MFPLIFCSLCAQKLWRVRTFLEMTNVCATTQLLTTSSTISLVYVTAGTFFAHGGRYIFRRNASFLQNLEQFSSTCQPRALLHDDVPVRRIFMRVRSL